ncbi:MAG: trimethylamine methyltransferase family protein [Planctomycetota bacterium]
MKLRLQPLPDNEFDALEDAVLRLLSEVGVLFEHDKARDLLRKAGNSVDGSGRVLLKRSFVESMIRSIPRDGFAMFGRDESRSLRVACDSVASRPSTGAPFILDFSTRRRRNVTLDDSRNMVLLTDALDNYDMVNNVVNPFDSPGAGENLRLFAGVHRSSLKPSDITVMTPDEVRGIARIAAAIRGGESSLREKPLTLIDVAMITPLRCAAEQVEALLECARLGLPVEVLTSPSLGVSSPLTLPAGAALAVAECLAALCLLYLVAPGLGVVNTARVSPVNMRTTAYNYGTPDLGIASVLVADVCARYRLPTNLYGFGTVAKSVGAQSSMEKTFSGLLLGLSQPHMITGPAILDNAMCTSPELLVIDNEALRFIKHVRRDIPVNDDTLAVDLLKRFVADPSLAILAEDHTLRHLRAGETLDCSLGQWTSYDQWIAAGSPDLFDLAHLKVEEILSSHSVDPFPADVERDIRRILKDTP